MAQLVYSTESGTYAGGGSFGPVGGLPYALDTTFPYDAAAPTGTQWTANDAPYFDVANENATLCATITYSNNFGLLSLPTDSSVKSPRLSDLGLDESTAMAIYGDRGSGKPESATWAVHFHEHKPIGAVFGDLGAADVE